MKRGLSREDLFVCVHEHFMTETARMADIVLPATMFLEHDDLYQGGGHQYIMFGPKAVDAPGRMPLQSRPPSAPSPDASAPSIAASI